MSNWIDCADELPQRYEEVMIWPLIDSYGEKRTAWLSCSDVWLYSLETENISDTMKVNHNIEYWQPLPDSPF